MDSRNHRTSLHAETSKCDVKFISLVPSPLCPARSASAKERANCKLLGYLLQKGLKLLSWKHVGYCMICKKGFWASIDLEKVRFQREGGSSDLESGADSDEDDDDEEKVDDVEKKDGDEEEKGDDDEDSSASETE